MHRLLVTSEELLAESPTLGKEAANHLKVLRPRNGEQIELFDGIGSTRVFVYDGTAGTLRATSADVVRHPRPKPLTLFACVTKGSRWDWTVEKATELGVTRIVPVVSERTIVRIAEAERAAKRERWQRIAEEAARQSDAAWLPEILAPVTFGKSLELVRQTTCLVGALTVPPPPPIAAALSSLDLSASSELSAYVGPEGDFSPDELAALKEIAIPVSFGTTILRAETASIYGLSVLKSHLDSL